MAGTTASLNLTNQQIDTSWDGIVIIDRIEGIPGGKTLNTVGYGTPLPEYIRSGHLIIEETATGILKPMPVSGTAYAALPAGHTYKGINETTLLTQLPFSAIMVRGSFNQVAFVNSGGYATPAGAITALPLIRFTKD